MVSTVLSRSALRTDLPAAPPTTTNLRDKRGVLEWSFDAKPGEAKDINFAWRLRWPQEADGFGGAAHDRLLLEVMDTGAGIKPEETPDVFNPFFTTKSGGTGLGLAIAHKIVEDHGGTVTFRSSPGQGTVFTIYLPAYVAPPASKAKP